MQRDHALQIFTAGIQAVQPAQRMQAYLQLTKDALLIDGYVLPRNSLRNIYVIGAGKAAAAMAVATEQLLGDLITGGLVTTKYGHRLPARYITIQEAAHPVPDENSVAAVHETLQLLGNAGKDDLVLCLLSGGASALWCDVPAGLALADVQQAFDVLIKSGAGIREINTVRKHLGSIKGGQLVRYCGGAKVFACIISDVPGDDLAVIASGPTVPDDATFRDAVDILLKYQLWHRLPQSIQQFLEKGLQHLLPETPGPGTLFNHTYNTIIGSNHIALQAAAAKAAALGYQVHLIPQPVTGDAATAARDLIQLAATWQGEKPLCILQGGETTIQVTGAGKGGRNQHLALAALQALAQLPGDIADTITLLSGGTDGSDGPTDAAGAIADRNTLQEAVQKKLSIADYLQQHDSYHFFEQTNSLLITGPTQTNVMDVMLVLVQ